LAQKIFTVQFFIDRHRPAEFSGTAGDIDVSPRIITELPHQIHIFKRFDRANQNGRRVPDGFGYDVETQELHVRFLKSGETYVYHAVEEWRYQEFQHADSKGQYLNANIKPNYQFAKV